MDTCAMINIPICKGYASIYPTIQSRKPKPLGHPEQCVDICADLNILRLYPLPQSTAVNTSARFIPYLAVKREEEAAFYVK